MRRRQFSPSSLIVHLQGEHSSVANGFFCSTLWTANCATIIVLLNKEATEGMGITMVAQQPSAVSEKDAHFREEEEKQDEKGCRLAAQQLNLMLRNNAQQDLARTIPDALPLAKWSPKRWILNYLSSTVKR
ncbi:hypothetical protein T09_821 [Trichinella sp. T9]|nr:hypothetical protein T09_821 [Trichinella sp. T9]